MRIVTWNINGTRARLENALAYLRDASPDVICFQEIKCTDDAFPSLEFEALGYNVAVHGQKGFNGVAILSKSPIDSVTRGLPGDDSDVQARYIEGYVSLPGGSVCVASIYLPNGNPIGTEKFTYKLSWMKRLKSQAGRLLDFETPVVLAGDYNVIPEPADAKRPDAWTGDALFQPESRALYRELIHLGYLDAVRAVEPGPDVYTFWDYQAGAWSKNNGIRIDHLLLSPAAADRLQASGVDKQTRAWEKPSDHVPAWIDLHF